MNVDVIYSFCRRIKIERRCGGVEKKLGRRCKL